MSGPWEMRIQTHLESEIEGAFHSQIEHPVHQTPVEAKMHTNKQPYNFSFCSKFFSKVSSLENHVRVHTWEKLSICFLYKIILCCKEFESSHENSYWRITIQLLYLHKTICRKREFENSHRRKTIQVFLLLKIFSQPSNMKAHLKIHTEEKSYKCTFCSKSFSQQSYTKANLKIHSGEKYKCSFCSTVLHEGQFEDTHRMETSISFAQNLFLNNRTWRTLWRSIQRSPTPTSVCMFNVTIRNSADTTIQCSDKLNRQYQIYEETIGNQNVTPFH